MASEDQIVLKIAIDHQAVLKGIAEIQKSTAVMEKSSNASIRNIGKNLNAMAENWKRVASAAKSSDIANLEIDPGGKKSKELQNLRKLVEAFNKQAIGLAAGLKDATAVELKDPISGQTLSAAKSFLQDMQQIARIIEQINSLHSISANLMSRNDAAAKRQAATYQTLADNVAKGLDVAATPGKGFGLGLDDLEAEIKGLVSNAKAELKTLEDTDLDFAKVLKLRQAREKLENLREIAGQLFTHARGPERELVGEQMLDDINRINENLKNAPDNVNAFITSVNALNSSFNTTLQTSQALKDEIKRLKIDPETEDVNLGQVNAQAQKLQQTMSDIFKTGNEEAIAMAHTIDKQVAKGLLDAGKDSGKMLKALKDGNKELNEFARTLPGLKDELKEIGDAPPIFDEKKLNTRKVEAEVKRLTTSLARLQKSNSQSVKDTGKDYQRMGDKIVDAYTKEEAGSEETIKNLRRVRSAANETGNAFKDSFDEVERSSGKSTVSIWKVGTALDRVGVRGAGGIARVIDVFRDYPVPILAAAAAVGGLLIITSKLVGVVVELGKKAAEAFLEFTKGSIASSREMEVLDRQLTSFLRGNGELAEKLRNNLLDLSLVVGQDLTKSFARTLVPLVSNQDQIERLAEGISAISFSFPDTDFERVTTIFRQMVSNQFRGAKLTLGFTESDIKRTQAFQEENGALLGALQGLEDFMQRRGISFDALSDSMSVAEGRAKAFRTQIELAFGDPIKDELGEILTGIIDFIDENKKDILDFFDFVGEGISELVGQLGDFAQEFIESFSKEDVADLELSFGELQGAASDFLDTIRDISGEDFDTLKGGLTGILDLMTKIVEAGDKVASIFASLDSIISLDADIKDLSNMDAALTKIYSETLPGLMGGLKDRGRDLGEAMGAETAAGFLTGVEITAEGEDAMAERLNLDLSRRKAEDIGKVIFAGIVDGFYTGTGIDIGRLFGIGSKDFIELGKKYQQGIIEGASAVDTSLGQGFIDQLLVQTASDDDLDAMLEYNAALNELDNIAPEAAEAQEKINEAMDALNVERISKEMKLAVDMERKLLKLENDFSRKREEIHIKQGSRIEEINIDWHNSLAELELEFDRKGEDILRDYNRKIEDLEQDSVDKKIDIEKKFRDRLKEIRAKFDFDAQEAIRMNDAVALLRIRRRMAFELQQAKDRRDNETKGVDEAEAKKQRDLQVWLDRQREDAKTNEDRKLADLITADANKRAEIFRQYKLELDAQRRSEQQKRDDLEQWRDWQEEDNQTWWDESIAKLDKNLETEYNTIKKWKEAELRLARAMNAQITRAMTLRISPFSSFGGGGDVNALTPFSSFGTGIRFRDLSPVQLTTGGMHLGGFQTPGTRGTMVGERGPEPFFPTQAGVIAPHVPLMMSTGIGPAGGTVNNDHSVNADISTLDPSQISPMQQTIMKSIFMDQMLALQFGE